MEYSGIHNIGGRLGQRRRGTAFFSAAFGHRCARCCSHLYLHAATAACVLVDGTAVVRVDGLLQVFFPQMRRCRACALQTQHNFVGDFWRIFCKILFFRARATSWFVFGFGYEKPFANLPSHLVSLTCLSQGNPSLSSTSSPLASPPLSFLTTAASSPWRRSSLEKKQRTLKWGQVSPSRVNSSTACTEVRFSACARRQIRVLLQL